MILNFFSTTQVVEDKKVVLPIEDKKDVEVKETGSPPPPAPAPAPESVPEAPVKVETPVAEPPDLLVRLTLYVSTEKECIA